MLTTLIPGDPCVHLYRGKGADPHLERVERRGDDCLRPEGEKGWELYPPTPCLRSLCGELCN